MHPEKDISLSRMIGDQKSGTKLSSTATSFMSGPELMAKPEDGSVRSLGKFTGEKTEKEGFGTST